MAMPALLLLASRVADLTTDTCRKAFIGAVAVRADGVVVVSRNGSALTDHREPSVHAEARLCKKSGACPTIYVARVKRDGSLAMSKPCSRCLAVMHSKRVEVVYYTIGGNEWGFLIP